MSEPCDQVRDRLPELLEKQGDPGVLAHLESCQSCRLDMEGLKGAAALLRGLGRSLEHLDPAARSLPAPFRRWMPYAAAASLLLAGAVWMGRAPARTLPDQATSPAFRRAMPGDRLEVSGAGLQLVWESGTCVQFSPGARARLGQGASLSLEAGGLWARFAGPGRIDTPAGALCAEGAAECVVEVRGGVSGPIAAFLRDADAAPDAPQVRLLAVSGQLSWTAPSGAAAAVETGRGFIVEDGEGGLRATDTRWIQGLVPSLPPALPAGGLRLNPDGGQAEAGLRLQDAAQGYAWEAVVRRSPGSTVGVVFPSARGRRLWLLASEGAGEEVLTLGLRQTAGRIFAEVNARPAWSCPDSDEALERFPASSSAMGVGIQAWGSGVLVVESMRLQESSIPVLVVGTRE